MRARQLFSVAVLVVAPVAASAQITPELIRARTEREWTIKAEKMRRHMLPLMRSTTSTCGSS